VAALNHNDTTDAQKYFSDAYRLDPSNAFTLNNIGYIAELVGDRETAEMYYDAARTAVESNEKVTYATRPDAEGRRMMNLAGANEDDVDASLKAIQARKRGDRHPIQLMLRNGSIAPVATRPPQQEQQPGEVPTPPLPPPQLPYRDTPPHQQPSSGSQPLPSDQSPPPPPTDQ
jgi:hypothetical protein